MAVSLTNATNKRARDTHCILVGTCLLICNQGDWLLLEKLGGREAKKLSFTEHGGVPSSSLSVSENCRDKVQRENMNQNKNILNLPR